LLKATASGTTFQAIKWQLWDLSIERGCTTDCSQSLEKEGRGWEEDDYGKK
jgi:hypothetical protein